MNRLVLQPSIPSNNTCNLATNQLSHSLSPRFPDINLPNLILSTASFLPLPSSPSKGRYTRSKTPPGRLPRSHAFHRVAYRFADFPAPFESPSSADLAARVIASRFRYPSSESTAMAPPTISALGMALNRKSASVDIPKPRDTVAGRDNFTAVPANSKHCGEMLPTPPNSISPNLPPHGRRESRTNQSSTGGHVDSDVDLHDVQEEPHPNALSAEALDSLGDLDSVGAITPGLLAKHHLPDILLSHGPLAIRHIMGYLTTSVPGFSRITSAKARRLVVAALEGRGSGVDGGGLHGNVVFEKVGWGRWDARLKGQPARERPASNITPPGSLPSSYSHGLQVPGQTSHNSGSDRLGTSMTGNSAVFSHSEADYEDQDMLELEADKMSLDGDNEAYASSEAPEPIDEDLGEGDVTDEEDWASIGAEALRARSLPKSPRIPAGGGRIYQPIASYSTAPQYRSRTLGNLAQSAPTKPIPLNAQCSLSLQHDAGVNSISERAAIEALLSLGSM